MKFQKIEGFKKMTEEVMRNTTGGGNTDTTRHTLDTMKVPKATNCLISDGKGGKMNTFDRMD